MLNGGIPEGDSVLVAGPSGTGKSVLTTQFIAEGVRKGEPGIVAVFEERPQDYTGRAFSYGLDLETPQREGLLKLLYLRPLDLSVDETLHELLEAVNKIGAKRVVIDSLAGFEMALAPAFRQDFRDSSHNDRHDFYNARGPDFRRGGYIPREFYARQYDRELKQTLGGHSPRCQETDMNSTGKLRKGEQ